eukprot:TRINITY_DN6925_c0_g1_i1.p1 TRINITY_DN6925_c0_g1~~TRINITY_DN6925_c0_g1_i1.p1  ORF type:complete len:520 (-),score=72.01 TRINITY_DN6925_c0_g1_i1:44-1396(-)
MKSGEGVGRYLITEEGINLGERIIVENPYASVLAREHNLTRCHHCLKVCYSLLPCESCPFSLYCSAKCKEMSVYYHKVECGKNVFNIAPTLLTLAIRILQRKSNEVISASSSSVSKLPPSDYNLVHSFLPHYYSHAHPHLLNIIYDTIIMSHFIPELDEIALIRHFCQTTTNVYGVFDLLENVEKRGSESYIVSQEQIKIGEAVYCISTLFNHSCQPNTILEYDGFRLSVIAKTNIKPGEEIFNCYGPSVGRLGTSQRKEILQSQYFFDCKCSACSAPETKPSPLTEEKLKKANQYLLKGRGILKHFERFNKDNRRWADAIDCFQKCKDLRSEVLSEPDLLLYEVEDAFAEAYAIVQNFERAAKHCKNSVIGLEKLYGKDSLEVGLEWAKYARVLFNAKHIDDNLIAIKKAQGIIENYRSLGGLYRETLDDLEQMQKCLLNFLSRTKGKG